MLVPFHACYNFIHRLHFSFEWISKMPLNDFASRGIQCHGMEFRIQGRARSIIPRVRRGASSSHESKDNKGLAFKVFWCFEVHAFVACPGILERSRYHARAWGGSELKSDKPYLSLHSLFCPPAFASCPHSAPTPVSLFSL